MSQYVIHKKTLLKEAITFELDEVLTNLGWYVRRDYRDHFLRNVVDGLSIYSMDYVIDMHNSTTHGVFLAVDFISRYKKEPDGPLWAVDALSQLVCYYAPKAGRGLLLNATDIKALIKKEPLPRSFSRSNGEGPYYKTERGHLVPWHETDRISMWKFNFAISESVMADLRSEEVSESSSDSLPES